MGADMTGISPEELKRQVESYRDAKRDHYDRYAAVLKAALERACSVHLPEAFVQARPKSVASFAEKCVRKAARYPDAVNQMTDLCGGRIIVQTLDQVKAVRRFIKANFTIVEEDEKGADFADAEFGYRDVHYIIRLDPARCGALGIGAADQAAIGDRRAEIQVRTWVQHAWADILHDRLYKTKLKAPREFRRLAGLLAALMEDGDRTFDRLALDIDGMLANFNAYAAREDVEREIGIQTLILDNVDGARKASGALTLARLLAARGDYGRALELLEPHAGVAGPLRADLLVELGYAGCKAALADPASAGFGRGVARLQEAVALCGDAEAANPLNLRRHTSLRARALARLAWALEAAGGRVHEARAHYQEALELEPGNPYYLADVIGHEINWLRRKDVVGAMRASIRSALATCREHIENGTELPYACFTAGRLRLLLDEPLEALGDYARGVAHSLSCTACVPPDVLEAEERWIRRVIEPDPPAGGYAWALTFLALARRAKAGAFGTPSAQTPLKAPVLLVSGGAVTLDREGAERFQAMLVEALAGFRGTVISGGTRCGVPGCVGAAAEALGGARLCSLVGYRPRVLPDDVARDERYDRAVPCDEPGFTPGQFLRSWEDLFDAGVRPESICLAGYGGGPLSAVEYRIALALGATVGLVDSSGGAAKALLADSRWAGQPNLLAIPPDPQTLRALIHPPVANAAIEARLDEMAMLFHADYVKNSTGRLPEPMKPWAKLKETFKTANREQARYSVQILEACGFGVRPAAAPADFAGFTPAEIERLAELEHGRWNVERLRNGWRYGKTRDDAKRIHDCLVAWPELSDGENGVKKYDRESVKNFPAILARAGLEVYRK
jgi:ppGpp synthetase/RelA/SpoT-type nucleotidyltranferase